MKKMFGVSILLAMLILGQPLMALADTTGPRTINYDEIESIIREQNIEVRINENDRLKSEAAYANLKRTIKDYEDDLEDINRQRDALGGSPILSAEKRGLLEALKVYERQLEDKPVSVAMADLLATINDHKQTLSAEGIFIGYNKSKLGSSTISVNLKTLENKLAAMQLQERLGIVSRNNLNDLRTMLVDGQTQLEGLKFQQDSLERQFKNLLNDQENTLVIGTLPAIDKNFIVEDKEADLAKALESSFTIKLQQQQIVSLQTALDRAKKDNGPSSTKYRLANYELINANLKLTQQKDALKSGYYTMLDDIAKIQSDLRLAEQNLEDKRVALSEAQVRMGLGLLSRLELDSVFAGYQIQENAVKTKQIDLFNAKCGYDWFLKGMPRSM